MKSLIIIMLVNALWLVSHSIKADIIVTDVDIQVGPNDDVFIDVDGDGIDDLRFLNYYNYWNTDNLQQKNGDLYVSGLNGAQVSSGKALDFGTVIDDSLATVSGSHLADYNYEWRRTCSSGSFGGCNISTFTTFTGEWNEDGSNIDGYLGFTLNNGDSTLYGWLEMSMYAVGYTSIYSYAYETVNSYAITAGQTISNAPSTDVPEPTTLFLFIASILGLIVVRYRTFNDGQLCLATS